MRTLAWIVFVVACDRSGSAKRDDAAVAIAPPRDAATDAPSHPPPRPEEVLVPSNDWRPPFYLDRAETTIAEYQACIKAKQCTVPNRRADLELDTSVAIGGITLEQARAYCIWRGKKLPTWEQWSYAAYGDRPRDYPWGYHRPICERAWMRGCSPNDRPTSPGRPDGASQFGVLDMIGNVAEWTEDNEGFYTRSCVNWASTNGELVGGSASDDATGPTTARRETPLWPTPGWFDHAGQGVRCARPTSAPDPGLPPADPVLRAMLEGGGLVVERFATARDAFARVDTLCGKGKHGLPIAGDVAGERGWLVAIHGAPTVEAARKLAPPGTKVIEAPTGLARIIGVATCGSVADQSTLLVTAGTHVWTIKRPSTPTPYQLWLAPGTVARLELQCKQPPAKGNCRYAMTMAPPAEIVVRSGPRAGIVGPPFQADGSYACD